MAPGRMQKTLRVQPAEFQHRRWVSKSKHPGGTHLVMVDNSVHFVNDNIGSFPGRLGTWNFFAHDRKCAGLQMFHRQTTEQSANVGVLTAAGVLHVAVLDSVHSHIRAVNSGQNDVPLPSSVGNQRPRGVTAATVAGV